MRSALLFSCLIAFASPAFAQERVLGLLALPQVFGRDACDRFTPQPVPIRATPQGSVIGAIVVARPWTFEREGGCSGLEVAVRMNGAAADLALPTREYGYEQPGAIVVGARDGWFKLRLGAGAGWVGAAGTEFYPLDRLYMDSLAHLTAEWDGRIARTAAGAARAAPPSKERERSIRVRRSARVGGAQWFLVEILSESPCAGGGEPAVVASGWVPAHGTSGEPTIWFSSRGC